MKDRKLTHLLRQSAVILLCILMLLALMPFSAYAAVVKPDPEPEPPVDTEIPIDEVHFPDDVFRAYVKKHFDTTGNSKLNEDERSNAKKVALPNSGITTLKGVEYLTGLEELYIANNRLTELDLSSNYLLQTLFCPVNNLTSLDVSRNAGLEMLVCDGNPISYLNLSSNPKLYWLSFNDCNLTSLDVSQNTSIEQLSGDGNRLRTLTIGKNSALTTLNCRENELESLDVTGCPNLITIQVAGNRLKMLDLSKNTRLDFGYADYQYLSECFGTQTGSAVAKAKDGSFILDLREITGDLNQVYHVKVTNGGVYDNKSGIITFPPTLPASGATVTYEHTMYLEPNYQLKVKLHVTGENVTYTDKEKKEIEDKTLARLASTGDTKDPARSTFRQLRLRSTGIGRSYVSLKWNKVAGTKKYVVYANRCGKKYKYKKIAELTGTSWKATKAAGKRLRSGKYYKFFVAALDENGALLSASKTLHVTTRGGKYGNYKTVRVTGPKVKYDKNTKRYYNGYRKGILYMDYPGTMTIKADAVKPSKKTKVSVHRGIRFESSSPSVATVNSRGKITAKRAGSCYIYVYAQSGKYTRVHLTIAEPESAG